MKRLSLIIIFIQFCSTLFARAGGGGGHSSGGGGGHYSGRFYSGGRGGYHKWTSEDTYYLILILACIFVVSFVIWNSCKWFIRWRAIRTNRRLTKCAKADEIWDKDKLFCFIGEVYLRVQKAWMKQDMRIAEGIVTVSLQKNFQNILNRQRKQGLYNYIDKIDIKEIRVIALEDYLDNNKDNFTAYISGTMIDLMVNHKRKTVKHEPACAFEDIYHFVRVGDSWRVSEISNYVSIWTVAELKIITE